MKSILLSMIFVLFIATFGQSQNQFKTRQKSSGTAANNLNATLINGQQQLKSASLTNALYKPLPFQLNTQNIKTIYDSKVKRPIFIEKKVDKTKAGKLMSASDRCFDFLNSIASQTGINQPEQNFVIVNTQTDESGRQHIRLNQYFNQIPIYSSDVYVHLGNDKEILNGRFAQIDASFNCLPNISNEQAVNLATTQLKTFRKIATFNIEQQKLLDYTAPVSNLTIIDNPASAGNYTLSYCVKIRPNMIDEWIYFVDAKTGEIINKYNNTQFDGTTTSTATDLNGVTQTFNTLLSNNVYKMVDIAEDMYNASKGEGYIMTLDAQNSSPLSLSFAQITSTDNTWSNATAVSAHFNSTMTCRYYYNTMNRKSLNGKSGNIISFINVTNEDGTSMENAFWNGKNAFYGNGGTGFKPLAGALDVAAHELTHGVITNTANLDYINQSGAINESLADIFGCMVERKNWTIGEQIVKAQYFPSGALRDLSNPHNGGKQGDMYWQPNHTSEMYTGTDDNGGVHTNSGITNFAYYKYATVVSKDSAEQVFYKALCLYLTKSAQFIDLRLATKQAAKDLFGDNSREVTELDKAFDAVGIYEEQPTNASHDLAANTGQDYLFYTNLADKTSLYQYSMTNNSSATISSTQMFNKVSVCDDGSYAVFVSTAHNIIGINLSGATPVETQLTTDGSWDNVCISKDGKHIAAISSAIDTAIFVYDFAAAKWAKFHLYNPTTVENNTKTGGVLYADAIEFDYTSENIVYDAYNSIKAVSGNPIQYWDVGFIKVWNNLTNNFDNGQISKLFSSLPDSVSIGDPVFSKNSPYIIAYDYYDSRAQQYSIAGTNLETGVSSTIAQNVCWGFPSYSKLDDKIVYTSVNQSNQPYLAVIGLNADKISASGNASDLIDNSQWPVYYTKGTRNLGLAPIANFTSSYKTGTAPLTVLFSDLTVNDPVSWSWTFTGGSPSTSTDQNPSVTYSSTGTYDVSLKVTNNYGTNTVTKTGYLVVTENAGIPTISQSIMIYPNPVKRFLNIDAVNFVSNKSVIKIYTVEGKLVKQIAFTNNVDLSSLSGGMYILELTNNNQISRMKIIKE